jgi:hypothetical protein
MTTAGTLLQSPSYAQTGIRMTMQRGLQAKEVPLETFFHKIVMIRNNLRVLEQKVNASDRLSEADKFYLQQYITRCYGSLTTFNIPSKTSTTNFEPAPGQRWPRLLAQQSLRTERSKNPSRRTRGEAETLG